MSRTRIGKAALGPEEGRRVHVLAENHLMNLAGPRPVGAESRVVHVPRDIDKTVASAYVAMARLGSAAA